MGREGERQKNKQSIQNKTKQKTNEKTSAVVAYAGSIAIRKIEFNSF